MKSPRERRVRPLLQLPNWDGKIVLAGIFTLGYFFIAFILVRMSSLSDNQKDIATIVLAALGPQLGQIFGSIFRNTLSDERDAERRNDALKTAIETPSTVVTPPAIPPAEDLGEAVEDGARDGARAGVAAGMGAADEEELPEYAR